MTFATHNALDLAVAEAGSAWLCLVRRLPGREVWAMHDKDLFPQKSLTSLFTSG